LDRKVPWTVLDSIVGLFVIFGASFLLGGLVIPLLNSFASGADIKLQLLLGSIIQTGLIFLVLYYYLVVKYAVSFTSIGFQGKPLKDVFWVAVRWGTGIFIIVFVSGMIMERFVPGPHELQPFAQLVLDANSWTGLIIPFLIAVVIAPLGEEVFFRGFLYAALKQRFGMKVGLIAAGLIFGAMHFDLIRLLPLGLGGIGLALLYEKTDTIFAPIIAHGTWNGIMLILLIASSNSL